MTDSIRFLPGAVTGAAVTCLIRLLLLVVEVVVAVVTLLLIMVGCKTQL